MLTSTEEDETVVAELRRKFGLQLSDKFDTYFNLLRWVTSAQEIGFDTHQRLAKHLTLRRLFRLDHIVDELPDDDLVCKYYPLSYAGPCGRDTNDFLVFDELGKVDLSGLSQCVSTTAFVKQRFKFLEYLHERMKEMESRTGVQSGVVYVVDLKGLKPDRSLFGVISTLRSWWSILGEHYVGWMHHCLIINSPSFFSQVWKIFAASRPQMTKMKLNILGKSWKKELLNFVDADHLPKYWGGNAVDANGDERCSSRIHYPVTEKIPRAFYWKYQLRDDFFDGHETLRVPAGAEVHLAYSVKESNVTISWNMYSNEEYGFVMTFSKDFEDSASPTMEVCFPYFDYPGKVAPANETLKNCRIGVYYFCFVNEAWLCSADVKHRITFVNSSGQAADATKLT